jgi:2-methylaconitate cis-trans-isomerase PrpF
VAHQVARGDGGAASRGAIDDRTVVIEHPGGKLETRMALRRDSVDELPVFERAGIVRTARPLLDGVVHVPAAVWRG